MHGRAGGGRGVPLPGLLAVAPLRDAVHLERRLAVDNLEEMRFDSTVNATVNGMMLRPKMASSFLAPGLAASACTAVAMRPAVRS